MNLPEESSPDGIEGAQGVSSGGRSHGGFCCHSCQYIKVAKDQVGHFDWPLKDPKAVSHLDQQKKQTSLFIAVITALILDEVRTGQFRPRHGFSGCWSIIKNKAPSMDSKIIDRLLAGVAYERTCEGSQDDSREERTRNFNLILDEDLQIAARMQESVESNGFHGTALNYQERRMYHWHEELDRRIGVDRVPEYLRVPRVLDNWVTDGLL